MAGLVIVKPGASTMPLSSVYHVATATERARMISQQQRDADSVMDQQIGLQEWRSDEFDLFHL